MVPEHLRYTSEHEWAESTETGTVRFGITDYAQDALGDVVFVTPPQLGAQVEAGVECGEVESTKSVSEIFAPVAGTISAVNDVVVTSPETINADPYGAGWIAEIQPSAADPLTGLQTASEYQLSIGE